MWDSSPVRSGDPTRQVRFQNTLDARDFTLVKHGFEVAVGGSCRSSRSRRGCRSSRSSSRPGAPHGLAIAALALWIGVIAVTLVFNAPVNAAAATWDPASPPLDWEPQRE